MSESRYLAGFKAQVKADPGAMPLGIIGTVQPGKRTQIRDSLIAVGDVQILFVIRISQKRGECPENCLAESERIADSQRSIPQIIIIRIVVGAGKFKGAVVPQIV